MEQHPHIEERRIAPHHYDLHKPDNSMEILKHIGTALVAMLPLGSAYMNIREDVLRNNIAITQIKEDIKTVEVTMHSLDKYITTLENTDRELRSNIDLVISSSSSNIRDLKKKLAELEKKK